MFDAQVDVVLVPCREEKRFVVRAVPVSAILGSVRGGFLAFIGFKWELPVWPALASLLNCPAHNMRLFWALTSNQKEEIRQIVRWQMDIFLSGIYSENPFKRKVQMKWQQLEQCR